MKIPTLNFNSAKTDVLEKKPLNMILVNDMSIITSNNN